MVDMTKKIALSVNAFTRLFWEGRFAYKGAPESDSAYFEQWVDRFIIIKYYGEKPTKGYNPLGIMDNESMKVYKKIRKHYTFEGWKN